MDITSTQSLSSILSSSYTVVSKLSGTWCMSKKSDRVVRAATAYWATKNVNALNCTEPFEGVEQKERRMGNQNFISCPNAGI